MPEITLWQRRLIWCLFGFPLTLLLFVCGQLLFHKDIGPVDVLDLLPDYDSLGERPSETILFRDAFSMIRESPSMDFQIDFLMQQ